MPTKLTQKEVIAQFKNVWGDMYDYKNVIYSGDQHDVCVICKIEGHGEFLVTPNNHKHKKSGCPLCGETLRRDNGRMSVETFTARAIKLHGDKYDYSKVSFKTVFDKICIICPEHGEFHARLWDHISRSGCPKCVESRGERAVRIWLENNSFKYIKEFSFDGCSDKSSLLFDFYIPESNICIEYDGEQHFKSIKFFGGNEKFKQRKHRDKIKTEYCKSENIPLIRIRYDESIEEKLSELLLD